MAGTTNILTTFSRDGLTFDVEDLGPRRGEPVVLLHGWPGGATTWAEVAPELAAQGFRVLVPDQRGYGEGARPAGIRPYVMDELVADVVGLLDAAGLDRAHVVGHDWGGAVAWALATAEPQRLGSLTVLSTPHPAALARAMRSSTQALRSAYVGWFQLPMVPERVLLAGGGRVLRAVLERSGLRADLAAAYTDRQREPGALRASLAWYRALRFGGVRPTPDVDADVPTLYVWSTGDGALGRHAAEHTGDHVHGPYRFEVLPGVPHWIPEEAPGLTAALVAGHVRAHPLR